MVRRTPIKLLLFDIFGTVVAPRKPPAIQYAEEVRSAGVHISNTDMTTGFKLSLKRMSREYPIYGRNTDLSSPNEWWTLLIKESLIKAKISQETIDAIMPKLGPRLLERFSSKEGYKLSEGVPGLFQELDKFKRLRRKKNHKDNEEEKEAFSLRWNLATNSDVGILLACTSLGLDEYFNLTTKGQNGLENYDPPQSNPTSSERRDDEKEASSLSEPSLSYFLGSEKPDKSFFHKAVQKSFPQDTGLSLNELCAQTLYIGDGLAEDYKGARNAGLQAVWLQRNQLWPSDMPEVERKEVLALKSIRAIIDIIRESWS